MSKSDIELSQLEHIIKFEHQLYPFLLLRPLSAYHIFIKNQLPSNKKRYFRKGLALCHGHNYDTDITSKIQFVKNWYYVDGNKSAYPDYVADITDGRSMYYFPNNYFDCVLYIYCPKDAELNAIHHTHRILKKRGVLCFIYKSKGLFWYMTSNEFDDLIQKVQEIIPSKNLDMFKQKMLELGAIDPDIDNNNFYQEVIFNYHGEGESELSKLINDISLDYTIRYLEKNNFKFINVKSDILFASPIK